MTRRREPSLPGKPSWPGWNGSNGCPWIEKTSGQPRRRYLIVKTNPTDPPVWLWTGGVIASIPWTSPTPSSAFIWPVPYWSRRPLLGLIARQGASQIRQPYPQAAIRSSAARIPLAVNPHGKQCMTVLNGGGLGQGTDGPLQSEGVLRSPPRAVITWSSPSSSETG